jgi:hypothetical protein
MEARGRPEGAAREERERPGGGPAEARGGQRRQTRRAPTHSCYNHFFSSSPFASRMLLPHLTAHTPTRTTTACQVNVMQEQQIVDMHRTNDRLTQIAMQARTPSRPPLAPLSPAPAAAPVSHVPSPASIQPSYDFIVLWWPRVYAPAAPLPPLSSSTHAHPSPAQAAQTLPHLPSPRSLSPPPSRDLTHSLLPGALLPCHTVCVCRR